MRRMFLRVGVAAVCGLMLGGEPSPADAQPAAAPTPGKTYRVGFSQIVDHPALNETRRGFVDGLRDAGFVAGTNLVFEYQNAQGNVGNARNIAEKFVADGVDLLAPCTTPNVQATIKVARGTAIPVVFGCVTNPVESGILQSVDQPTGINVTGMYGRLPAVDMIGLIMEMLPATKSIGTIYNGAESNSAATVAAAKAEATRRGVRWVEVQIASTGEVKTAIESLVGRADVFLTPQDNTLASAFDPVAKTARDNRIPLFSLDTTTVARGALASLGTDQYQVGVAWAKTAAVPVLLGADPASLVPVAYTAFDLYLNRATATADGIAIPAAVLARVHQAYDK